MAMREFKISGILIAVLTVGLLVLLEILAGPRVRFSELVVPQNEWLRLMGTRTESSDELLKNLSFDGENLAYDTSEDRWFYSLVEGSSTAYDPSVKLPDGVQLAVLEDKLSEEMVAENEPRKLMAYTDSEYRVYDVVLTTLPVMEIEYGGGEISDEEGLQGTDSVMANVVLFDNRKGAKQRMTVSKSEIHVRGRGSAGFPKKSFKLNLKIESLGDNLRKNDLALLGMRQDDDWILYSPYLDDEKVRNVFASNLWNEASADNNSFKVHNGYEYKYVELLMNGEYYGLYALGYQVDEDSMKLKTDNSGEYREYMFKRPDWGDDSSVIDGFLLDTATVYENEAWNELRRYQEMVYEGEDESQLYAVSDLDTATDYYLFINFIQGTDQIWDNENKSLKNVWLTLKERDGEYVALYTPWDLDLILGHTWRCEYEESCANGQSHEVGVKDNYLAQGLTVSRLMELGSQTALRMVMDRYSELRKSMWSDDHVNELVDEYEKDIYGSGAFSRDEEMWPEGNYNDKDEGLSNFRDYVVKRLHYLDEYYNVRYWEEESETVDDVV